MCTIPTLRIRPYPLLLGPSWVVICITEPGVHLIRSRTSWSHLSSISSRLIEHVAILDTLTCNQWVLLARCH